MGNPPGKGIHPACGKSTSAKGGRSIQACGRTQHGARHVGYKHARLCGNKGARKDPERETNLAQASSGPKSTNLELHSATIAASELGADVVQSHDVLAKLQII